MIYANKYLLIVGKVSDNLLTEETISNRFAVWDMMSIKTFLLEPAVQNKKFFATSVKSSATTLYFSSDSEFTAASL